MQLTDIASHLTAKLAATPLGGSVAHIYHPYQYAWQPASRYLSRYGAGRKRVLLVGMNPGPYGMVQTGVPFGDVPSVRDFLGITGRVDVPDVLHPARPILGFHCSRREVSGSRLWSFVADTFVTPAAFFADYFVYNYCPLAFMAESGKNLTPVDLPAARRQAIELHCDRALVQTVQALGVEWVIGIGGFAAKRCQLALTDTPGLQFAQVLHPSPASPAANRGWAEAVTAQLLRLGLPLGRLATRQSAKTGPTAAGRRGSRPS